MSVKRRRLPGPRERDITFTFEFVREEKRRGTKCFESLLLSNLSVKREWRDVCVCVCEMGEREREFLFFLRP